MNTFFSLNDCFTSSTAEYDEKFHYLTLTGVSDTGIVHFCIPTRHALKPFSAVERVLHG